MLIADFSAPIMPNPMLPVSAVKLKRFISFSGGVESTTMCILYGKGATAIWCDTGDEEEEMYARVDYVEKMIKIIHNDDFELIRISPTVVAKGIECKTLDEAIIAWNYFPSANARYCTSKFKIEPIDDFLETQGECELMIGFNADEEPSKDRTGNFMKCKNVAYTYPLYNDGISRDECEEILNKYGLHPNFPIYMKRGGCKKCFFKGIGELKSKYLFNPKAFEIDKQFEIKMNEKSNRKKFYHINMNAGKTYQSIQDEVEREIKSWGLENVLSMYKKIETHKPCGAFCHR